MAIPLAVAAIPSIISGISSIFGAKKKQKAQKELMNYQRSIRLDPVTGRYGGINVDNGNVDLGQFGDLQDMMGEQAGSMFGDIFSQGVPEDVQSFFQQLAGTRGMSAGQSQFGMNSFGAAAGLMPELAMGGDAVRERTLGLLREQARPEEERLSQAHTQGLFNRGQMGTTGGAMQTEAFAKGLGQADLMRQLAAGEEGRAHSSDLLKRFTELSGVGAENIGAEQDFLGKMVSGAGAMAELPGSLQAGRMDLFNALLKNMSGIQGMGMDAQAQALATAQAGTDVKLRGAGLQGAMMSNPGYSASPVADAFGSLGAGMSRPGQPSIMDVFGKLFAKNGASGDRFQTA
jgi:hypothetical protein